MGFRAKIQRMFYKQRVNANLETVMKYLLSTLLALAFGIVGSAQAQTGMFYNVDRSGEGIVVTVNPKKDLLGFAFFTYWDVVVSTPPTVSPAPPESLLPSLWNSCPVPAMPGTTIPPTVSPPPPTPPDEPTDRRGGSQAWFIGVGAYQDGIALGDMYWHHGVDYPNVDPYLGLSVEYKVAAFMMEGSGKGFDLYLDCSPYLPASLFMCNNVMTFRSLVIGE